MLSYDDVIGVHDLLVHNYGPGRTMISLHAEVPADGDILTLHDMIDNIERDLRSRLKCDAVIHMDPVCVNDPFVNELRARVCGFLNDIDVSLSLHDFRVVKGPTHTNIIFDVLIPYRFRLSDEEICRILRERIGELDSNYFAVINVDKKYT